MTFTISRTIIWAVGDELSKNLGAPDDSVEFPGLIVHLVEVGDMTIGRTTTEPGWKWSTHMQPLVGGEWCMARHVGVTLSGRWGVLLRDGRRAEFGPDDVYDVPPGHDGYIIGDQPAVVIEWSGLRAFSGARAGLHGRVLATLLFTDLVESTATAVRLGDRAWRELLSEHYQGVRSDLERFRGREINTTGDGLLAIFEGPALALGCVAALRARTLRQGLHIRAGVHIGEVELVGSDIRGVAVHEAARIMGQAGPDEILVSEITRTLAGGVDLRFEDRGERELKGLPGTWHLFALAD